IRRNVSYMSGIRATMESILLGVPVVVASTAGLREYFPDEGRVVFFDPENVESLVGAIKSIEVSDESRKQLIGCALDFVKERYSLESYVNSLERLIIGVRSGSPSQTLDIYS